MAKEIQLSQGKVAIDDDEDFEYLNQWKWSANNPKGKCYAVRSITIEKGKRTRIIMHRLIMNANKGFVIDHIDGQTLNNLKSNLRICTHAENLRNRKVSVNSKSRDKGVYYDKKTEKWIAEINKDRKRVWTKYFMNPIDAAKAYNEAAIKFHGEFAKLNEI